MKRLAVVLSFLLFAVSANAQPIETSSRTISVTPTIDTNIYASGDALGGKMTIAGAGRVGVGSGVIHSVLVSDLAEQGADIDIIIFSSNPSGTTFTNNAELDVADADNPKAVCVIQVTNDAALADTGLSFATGNNCVFAADTATGTLYAAAVVRGTPTYASASDLTFRFSILQD